MAIKKFKKEETNKKNVIKIVSAFMVIGIMLAGISYAVYQHEDEKLFINAKVGEFKENDIELAIKLDGEQIDIPPAKDNYIVIVECDYADGEWDSEKWGANIRNISASKVKCNVNFATPEPTLTEVTATSLSTSIDLSYESKGVNVRTTCKWGTEEGVYPNEVEGATNTNCTIEGLEMETTYYYQVCAKNTSGEVCKEGNIKTRPLTEIVKIGDYISMTPTSTSYIIPTSLTGYTSNQTINPSELNLWRVIKKNEDGTVEVVSEYASSTQVYFYGQTGYINLVGSLNTIASQYTNEKYVGKTRHIGYSNQIGKLTNTSKLSQTSQPWAKQTSVWNQWLGCNTGTFQCGANESYGAGDIGYQTDYNLINGVLKTMAVKTPSGASVVYYLASRFYGFPGAANYWVFEARYVTASGGLTTKTIYQYKSGFENILINASIRPILTLKEDVGISNGDGQSAETAYQLQ